MKNLFSKLKLAGTLYTSLCHDLLTISTQINRTNSTIVTELLQKQRKNTFTEKIPSLKIQSKDHAFELNLKSQFLD